MHRVRMQPLGAHTEGLLLLTEDIGGKKSWLALLCGWRSQGWFILHRFSLPVAQAPTLIESDSLNQKVNNPSSIDSGFNLSAAEIT